VARPLALASALAAALGLGGLSGLGGLASLAACAHPGTTTPAPRIVDDAPDAPRSKGADPDLAPAPTHRLLDIKWDEVVLADDAAALALWRKIAPTGEDWEDKLVEIPTDRPVARALGLALLRQGNFACAAPPTPAHSCAHHPIDLPAPAPTATLDDPCLRRLLALWALGQLEIDDVDQITDALTAIAALPPPESELTEAALHVISDDRGALKLKLIAIAAAAGQHELADTAIGTLDEPQLIEAISKLHIDGALTVLSAEGDRPLFLKAIVDDKLRSKTRVQAIHEVVAAEDPLAADSKATLVAAAKGSDCAVAATAARLLAQDGDRRFVPTRPRTKKPDELLHALCVLVGYDEELGADEVSPFGSYLPARGLELVRVSYDPYGEVDNDGDGDPHTEHTTELIPPGEVSVPEADDLARALTHCQGTVCTTDDHEFRFTFKPGAGGYLLLTRLEVIERPACEASVP
jgi:hypothetical protein